MADLAATFASIGVAQMLAIWLTLIAASLLRAFTGFGFALAAVPVLSLFVLPTEAVVLACALTLFANLSSLHSYRNDYPLRGVLPLAAMSVCGTAFGVTLLSGFSVAEFQLWIGIGVLAACVLLTLYHPRPRRPGAAETAVVGLLSGVMNGVFAIPGPPVIIYAMATEPEPHRSRALLMWFFMLSAVIALVTFAVAGYVTQRALWLFLLATPAMLIGDKVGITLFRRHGGAIYRRLALVLLYLIGISITAKALLG
jgi:uncharacterized membrane protein YfcA